MITIPISQFTNRTQSSLPWDDIPFNDGVFVAGGSVRNLFLGKPQDTDVDLFVSSKEAFDKQTQSLRGSHFAFSRGNEKFAEFTRDKLKVQVVGIEHYPTVEACLESFDFTICQFGLSPNRQELIATEGAMIDAARNRLAVLSVKYPVATMRRFHKYMGQGFKPCNETYAKFVELVRALTEVDLKTYYID